MKPDDETVDEQGARDWAHSIQKRQAEILAAKVARSAGSGEMDFAYREAMHRLVLEAGVDPIIASKMLDRPKLEKIGEFDEPDVRRVSGELVQMLVETMDGAGMATGGRKLIVSSLASGQVNALCATNTWDEKHYHIFVDSDLGVFCNSIGKLVSECFIRDNVKAGKIGFGRKKLLRNVRSAEIQKRTADLFCSCVLKGTARASEPWLPTSGALGLSLLLTNALNLFPLAHELGHLHLGHLEAEETRQIAVEGIDELDAAVYARDDEFAADSVGAIVTNQTMIHFGATNAVVHLAPYIFLRSVDVLDACYAIFDKKAGAMSFTHPSARDRARRIRPQLLQHARYHNSGDSLPDAFDAVDLVINGFADCATANLKRLKSMGRTPRERVRLTVSEHDRPRILGLLPDKLVA